MAQELKCSTGKYITLSGQDYREVHKGFLQLTCSLSPSIAEIAKELDPTIPCYVTGHSLGAAIATLVAMELSQAVPQIKDQEQELGSDRTSAFLKPLQFKNG